MATAHCTAITFGIPYWRTDNINGCWMKQGFGWKVKTTDKEANLVSVKMKCIKHPIQETKSIDEGEIIVTYRIDIRYKYMLLSYSKNRRKNSYK